MSFIVAPIEVLTDDMLTDPERRVLLALFSFRGKDTNTVWPSLNAIAERAHINDLARVSKITSSLASKGWLTKKKRGFTGCNEYSLCVPDRLDDKSNLAPDTKLEPSTNSNLVSDTKSNLAPDTKYKEDTNEHTIEQTNTVGEQSKRKGRKPRPEITIADYIENCKNEGKLAIPGDHPVFDYASRVGIPFDFLLLAWKVFRDDMTSRLKKQKDWPATFKIYVEKDWVKIWAINRDGEYYLNTAGKQAELKYRNNP